jgi:type VI secretion system secreted protein VgrG
MGFLKEEGLNVLSRTADVVGGAGMVLGGAAACTTGVGCTGGAPLAALGASSIQEGWTGESGFARSAATSALGPTAGNAATDIVNIGTSVTGLFKATLRPGTWKMFRNISSDFVPAYQTMTKTGLSVEIGGTALGAASATCTYVGK